MRMLQSKRRCVSIILTFFLAFTLCSPIAQTVTQASAADTVYRAELTAGQQNIVKRAYQMTDIHWTPLQDIAGWNNELTYRAGTTYTGLPYGQPVNASYVPWSTSLVDFLGMVNNPSSKMYTSYSSYEARAPYYSTDCSAFVSWAWGLGSRQTTSTIKNFATQISTTSYADAQVGDCLCLAGSHIVLITDITYDENSAINSIEISESTVSSVSYCCHKIRYGVGGKYTLEYLTSKYFGNGYILYRSNTRDNVTYNHSCAVPLEGDVCTACGLGDFTETTIDLVVTSTSDITLYSLPNRNADQIGTIYAGNEITVIASSEDSAGTLWYKTADGEWILAENTVSVCRHVYSYSITAVPSCIEDGVGIFVCDLCGDEYTEVLSATGHIYEANIIPAACETDGYIEYCCANCGDSYFDNAVPATGHSFDSGVCSDCGARDSAIMKGDLNNDSQITSADSVLLARYLADLQDLNETQLQAADINGDGEITSADSVLLARHLAGLSEINQVRNKVETL